MDFKTYLVVECHLSAQTVSAYVSDVNHLKMVIGCDVPNEEHMITYLTALNDAAFMTTSIQRKMSAIKLYLTFLRDKKKEVVPNVGDVFQASTPFRLPKLMTKASLKKALSFDFSGSSHACRNQLIVALLYYAGCRVSEVTDLLRRSVFSDSLIVKGKGEKERIIPMAIPLMERMTAYINTMDNTSSPWLFPGRKKQPITRQTVSNVIKYLRIGTGIMDQLTPHTFRHMFATNLLEKGLDLRDIQLLLGHSSIMTTQIYTHVNTSKLKHTFESYHPLS